MCGRYTLRTPAKELAEIFALTRAPDVAPRYNIAPTQAVGIVRCAAEGMGRHWDDVQWGLVPSWSKDPRTGARLINARAETVATKPSFRAAFRRRRCLVPADGFYEWERRSAKQKIPYWIHLADERPFAFAGLWEHWSDDRGNELNSCSIITTDSNAAVARIHDRMPVILPPATYDVWLDPESPDLTVLQSLLKPYPAADMVLTPVSSYVNNARHEGAQCLSPAS